MRENNIPNKILFLSLSGIGNLIMQLPAIEATKNKYPKAHITIWVAPRGTKAIAQNHSAIDSVIQAPLKQSIIRQLLFIMKLRQQKFDLAIMLSPGQLWKGSAYLTLAGIPNRIGHAYPHLGKQQSSFLLNKTTPELNKVHDTVQNLNLIKVIDNTLENVNPQYNLSLSEKTITQADALISKLGIDSSKRIIGMHAGTARGFEGKRWPLNRFVILAKKLITFHHAFILIYGGPEENKMKKQILMNVGKNNASIISADLLTTAATIKHCLLFISNDSGLMHLSAAVGTKTFGLFGPTDEILTGPQGTDSHVIRAPHTEAVYSTEANYDLGNTTHSSLLNLTPQMVFDVITKHLNA